MKFFKTLLTLSIRSTIWLLLLIYYGYNTYIGTEYIQGVAYGIGLGASVFAFLHEQFFRKREEMTMKKYYEAMKKYKDKS